MKDEKLKSTVAKKISRALRGAREKVGLSQSEVSRRSGMSVSHVNRLEQGRHVPSLVSVIKHARALGLDVYLLIEGKEKDVVIEEKLSDED